MRLERREAMALTLLAAMIVAGTGGALAMLASRKQPGSDATNTHTLFHIGCTHHNHGPAWHAGHGKSAGYQRPVGGAVAEPVKPMQSRALTAGR